MAGRVLNDRYRIGRLLGRGGMAEVYEAHDELLDRPVAVKVLRPDLAADPEVRSRFEIEARSAARLHHPNAVAVFDTGEDAGDPYLVMELLPGESLADRMGRSPMDQDWICAVARDVLAALGAAHDAGLVHRDVKPGNVLLTADGQAKVADFGIAKMVEAVGGDPTNTGLLLGTPAYLAPERIQGDPATPKSDLYSLGVVLYEALAGTKPFLADNPVSMANMVVTSEPRPLQVARPDLDPLLVAAVERAMARDPDQRPSTAAEMAADLGLAAAAPTVTIGSDSRPAAGLQPVDATIVSDPAELLVPPSPSSPSVPARGIESTGRRRLSLAVAVGAALVLVLVIAAFAGGDDSGTDRDGISDRLDNLAERVEIGDGPRGPEAAERLRAVADEVQAGGGGDSATDLMRDAMAWNASRDLSRTAFTNMVEVLRQVPGADASVAATTTATTAPAPPPPPPEDEDEDTDEEKEPESKGKGGGKGRD